MSGLRRRNNPMLVIYDTPNIYRDIVYCPMTGLFAVTGHGEARHRPSLDEAIALRDLIEQKEI
jgi:hypothetical protein